MMNRILPYITKNHLRQLLVFAAAVLIVLTPCSVKSSIKSLTGIPVNTEQGLSKHHHSFLGTASGTCVSVQMRDTKISQKASFDAIALLLTAISTSFIFLAAPRLPEEPSHPLYANLKIPGKLPLFLLYQKLMVNYPI